MADGSNAAAAPSCGSTRQERLCCLRFSAGVPVALSAPCCVRVPALPPLPSLAGLHRPLPKPANLLEAAAQADASSERSREKSERITEAQAQTHLILRNLACMQTSPTAHRTSLTSPRACLLLPSVMGGSSSKRSNKSGVADTNSVSDGGSAAAGGVSDDVVALTPEQAQAIAQDRAEANNARLKERRLAAQGGGVRRDLGDTTAATPEKKKASSRAARGSSTPNEKTGEASEKARSSRRKHNNAASASGDPKVWHKPPPHAAVTAAFSHSAHDLGDDGDDDLETITAEGGATFSARHAQQQEAPSSKRGGAQTGNKKQSEFGDSKSNINAAAVSSPSSSGHPPALLNPWSRPSLFQRNFADESRNAELFVQLARDRAAQLEKEAQAAASARDKDHRRAGGGGGDGRGRHHSKKKSSLMVAADREGALHSPPKSTVLHSTSRAEQDEDDEFERVM